MFEWVSNQKKVKNSIDFWQRETSSTNDLVSALDCALAIIDEIANKESEKNNSSSDLLSVFDYASNVIAEK